ncbi:hypothetical protein WICPIJ_008091 [Wickerhamomyces pijperi]|uniref:Major facilitator superfamily (MFS) profile domain-containing protein n=1 Tax=Wickerhamomyces pijperi TaxID=599730 RepID=A0A9P8PYL4_WICPI|nr:hypothetical protein WICPIJ_008091 [Wickerhamomyces pijperi]
MNQHEIRPMVATTMESDTPSIDIEDSQTGSFLYVIVFTAAVGGFLFGYDTACISSILMFLDGHETLQPDDSQKGVITGITSIGSLIGSLVAAFLSDKFGRKPILFVCCLVFVVSSVQLAASNSIDWLIKGRLIVGLSVGAASMVVPVYISEIAPQRRRGQLITINSISTTGGQLIANLIAYKIQGLSNALNWRLMFIFSGVPPLLVLALIRIIPESPRYLMLNNEYDKARESLTTIFPNSSAFQIEAKIHMLSKDIARIQRAKQEHSKKMIGKPAIRALAIGIMLMVYQQATGFNSFMYYGATIFKDLGMSDPLLISIGISGVNFIFTFVALKYIDTWGRRRMLLITTFLMTLSLFASSLTFQRDKDELAVWLILGFVACYASALGTVPWLSVEFLPLEIRSIGGSLISSTGWLTNFVVSVTYLQLMDYIHMSGTCLVFGLICAVGWVAVYQYYPEVNGLSLEEIRNIFQDGVNLNYGSFVVSDQDSRIGQ